MRRSLSLLGGMVLAVAFSQFPEYAQQYAQRLGGAVDELRVITTQFDQAAAHSGLSRAQALARFEDSQDQFIAGHGTSMEETFARYDLLSTTLARLQRGDALSRLRALPGYFDDEVAARTLDDFRPAVPVTTEGFVYAGVGLVLGYVIVSVLYSLIMLPFRRWSRGRLA